MDAHEDAAYKELSHTQNSLPYALHVYLNVDEYDSSSDAMSIKMQCAIGVYKRIRFVNSV